MGDMAEFFEPYKVMHKERVKKNPERLEYAVSLLKAKGIEHKVCNESTGHINCRTASGEVISFYAGTGKIKGYKQRGIRNLISLIEKKNSKIKPSKEMEK